MAEFGVLRPPATILFGEGTANAVGSVAAGLGQRVLLCTDGFLASSPHCALVRQSLRKADLQVSVLDAAVPELPRPDVERAVEAAKVLDPDCIVGLGGGSSLDLAKLIALGLSSDEPLDEFYGELRVTGPTIPVVAVPTTAGTGSEVTPVAVMTDAAVELKVGLSSPHLVPSAAICDPLLTHGAPADVTAFAGIDALAHAVEAHCSARRHTWDDMAARVFVGGNVLSDRFALHAIALIASSLQAAVDDDSEARARVLEGSLCAGLAFASAGTALAHALQYPVGARTRTPHGLGVGLLLPYVMAFNASACPGRMQAVAEALGTADGPLAAVERVRRLAIAVGVPKSLASLGVDRAELPRLAHQALGIERLLSNNPRSVDADDATAILQAAFDGEPAGLFDAADTGE